MKTYIKSHILLVAIVLFGACSSSPKQISEDILLTDNWKVQKSDLIQFGGEQVSSPSITTEGWYSASIPSTLMSVLIQNGLYTDVMESKKMKNIDKSIFDSPWWYRTEFEFPKTEDNKYIFLNFDGLIYSADIWLNGQLVASRDSVYGTFRQFSFDVTKYIKEKNVLAVQVFRPIAGDPNIGFADWNPRPADENMGLFRPVRLTVCGEAKMQHTYVHSKINLETLDEAWLTIQTQLKNMTDASLSGNLIGTFDGKTFSHAVTLAPDEERSLTLTPDDVAMLHVSNPRLWWCNNMGEPNLYDLNLKFVSDKDIVSSEEKVIFGIRHIDTYFTDAGHRGFTLNGKPVLLKGAGWTDDMFLRDNPERNEIQAKYVKDMNMNHIRFENFWGNNASIYDLCDKYGLLVLIGWSCQWEWDAYYGKPCSLEHGCIQSEEEMAIVAKSFRDQVLWLRNHPSIFAWMPGSDMLQKPELEKKYLEILKEIDNSRPYIGAAKARVSPVSGATGTKMAGPYEYVGPNYWYIDSLYGGAFGFNTETGNGAQLPVLESIKRFIPKDKLWPINDEWNYHCTASTTAMNSLDVMTKVMDEKYGKAADLDDYLKKANLINYDATRAMFEAFRVNIPHTTGIVHWMLNSAWPSLYWQLYDYYLVPTAGYYATKKANHPQQLIYNYGNHSVYLVNEGVEDLKDVNAVVEVYSVNSKLLSKDEIKVDIVNINASKQIFNLPEAKENIFIFLTLLDNNQTKLVDNCYVISVKSDEYKWAETTWVATPIKAYSDFKNLAHMPNVDIECDLDTKSSNDNEELILTMKNTSDAIAFFVEAKLMDENENMIIPVLWSDNYVTIPPHASVQLKCVVDKSATRSKKKSIVVSAWNSTKEIILE